MSAEEIAKIDSDAKAKQEEAARVAAEMKAKKEAPLTDDEKATTLAALNSGDTTATLESLKFLRGKAPKEPDPEIVDTIQPLLANSNKKVAEDAHAALCAWSPEYKKKADLNVAYRGFSPVGDSKRTVTESTPLYPGQIVQARYSPSFWFAAEVLEALADGKVLVRLCGGSRGDMSLPRSQIQLAPEEVDQPNKLASFDDTPKPRTWTDSTGKNKVEATYLGIEDNKVKLRRTDGKGIAVPLDRLSEEDQAFAKKL
ncbi:MAG: SHD1 domain-containing protein [Planctomycetota bacterium]|nr:SHD1 domain-containing protein [Planctomycetota bacterium]